MNGQQLGRDTHETNEVDIMKTTEHIIQESVKGEDGPNCSNDLHENTMVDSCQSRNQQQTQ